MIHTEPTVLVVSMGGVGSTAFMDFFAGQPEVAVNTGHGIINPLKHAVEPPTHLPSVRRAVFLFGCPYDSLVSLFRRGFAHAHYVTVAGLAPAGLDWPADAWQETCRRFELVQVGNTNKWVDAQGRHASDIGAIDWFRARKLDVQAARRLASERIEVLGREAFHDLDDYLLRGVDWLRRYEQVASWTSAPVPYPTLCLRYESLWEHLPEVMDFVQVSRRCITAFPARRRRVSDYRDLRPEQQERLVRLYGPLNKTLDALPDACVRRPNSSLRRA